MTSNPRKVVLNALLRVMSFGAYSNIVFDTEIKKSELSSKDVSFASAVFYGVLEKKITLDYIISLYSNVKLKKISDDVLQILRMGVYQIVFMDRVPDSAAVNESVKLLGKNKGARGFVNAVLRNVSRNKEKLEYKTESIKYSCPQWIIDRFYNAYGECVTKKILSSFDVKPDIVLRTNTLKTNTQKLINDFALKGTFEIEDVNGFDAIRLKNVGSVKSLPGFSEGLFHVQDLSSQFCCSVLAPSPGDVVVDVCAAPGGKSLTLAQMMKNQGKLFAFDIHESRIKLIKSSAKRLGVSIIESKVKDACIPYGETEIADKVLCDVPCSGLGILRRKPEIKYKDEGWFDELPHVQLKILNNAARLLRPSGMLVYSTCTLNPKENNEVVEKFLNDNKNFCVSEIRIFNGFKRIISEPSWQFTVVPCVDNNCDGFFIACLKRIR